MKYLLDFRDKSKVKALKEAIEKFSLPSFVFMEVCGTHTWSIFHHGLRSLFPPWMKHLSGPGCPVCVTPNDVIDYAIELTLKEKVILVTFGDMLKVPGSYMSLREAKAKGGKIRVIYSVEDALKIAKNFPDQPVVFLGIGFETTAPSIAWAVLKAREERIKNFYILPANKLIPPAIREILKSNPNLDGFLLPGHVSTIIGRTPYLFISEEFHKGGVISGFEPLDILFSLYLLLKMKKDASPRIVNQYKRSVKEEGNPKARMIMKKVFRVVDSKWRGLGMIPASGLDLKDEFREFNAYHVFPLNIPPPQEYPGCRCGEVLAGKIVPPECPLFGKACTPENPKGPCMVSVEGACGIYYRYGG